MARPNKNPEKDQIIYIRCTLDTKKVFRRVFKDTDYDTYEDFLKALLLLAGSTGMKIKGMI